MLLRSLLRRGSVAAAAAAGGGRAAARPDPPAALASLLLASRSYAKAKGGGKPAASTTNRGKVRAKDPRGVASEDAAAGDFASSAGGGDDLDAEFELPTDPLPPTYDPALDVGPGGRPLFAFTDTFASFSHRDANAYVDFTCYTAVDDISMSRLRALWQASVNATKRDYEKINPIKYVPALVDGDFIVSDSLAIILYLEDKYPQHPLLPQDLKKKVLNLQIANIVCSSIQPLQCYAVIGLADGKLGSSESLQIVQHYTDKGFRAIEKLLEGCASKYATGDEAQLADVFLAPQIHAGVTRFQIDMSKYPLLARFYEAYMEIPAFQDARPENQPDAPLS